MLPACSWCALYLLFLPFPHHPYIILRNKREEPHDYNIPADFIRIVAFALFWAGAPRLCHRSTAPGGARPSRTTIPSNPRAGPPSAIRYGRSRGLPGVVVPDGRREPRPCGGERAGQGDSGSWRGGGAAFWDPCRCAGAP